MLKTFVVLVYNDDRTMSVYDVLPIDTANPAHYSEQEIFQLAYEAPNFAKVLVEYDHGQSVWYN